MYEKLEAFLGKYLHIFRRYVPSAERKISFLWAMHILQKKLWDPSYIVGIYAHLLQIRVCYSWLWRRVVLRWRWRQQGPPKRRYPTALPTRRHNPEDLREDFTSLASVVSV